MACIDRSCVSVKDIDYSLQDTLMNLAKAVANAAAMLVLKAKNVAQVAEDTILQNRVIAAATQCALSTSQLVACTKVLILKRVHLCSQVDEDYAKRSQK